MTRRIGAINKLNAALGSFWHRMSVDFGGPSRAVKLNVPHNLQLTALPKNIYWGDVGRGVKILEGRFALGSQSLYFDKFGNPWVVSAPSEPFAARLHSFNWLADLAAIEGDKKLLKKTPDMLAEVQKSARQLCDGWIADFGKWNSYAWRTDILVQRVFSWLANWQVLLDGDAQTPAGAMRCANLYRQLKYVRSHYHHTPAGILRLKAAACLVMGGACFDGKQEGFLDKGLDLIDDEIDKQILPDGGHISRNPENVARALEILLVTESALVARGLQGSKEIGRAIDRLRPMLAFFMAGRAGLFSFNGGGTSQDLVLKKLFDPENPHPKSFVYAPHSHYQRLDRNGTVLMIDVGTSPPRPFDLEAHLAPLAFSLTTNEGPIIVNCGWNDAQPGHWRQSMRTSAAHSCLVLENKNIGKILEPGFAFLAIGPAIDQESGPVNCTRKEQETGTWLEASHDGYRGEFGLTHCRRIYMDVFGKDIRGEDSLFVPIGGVPKTREEIGFEIRFHLHPDIKATLAQDQKSALLIQPEGVGWRFRTDAGLVRLEKSVYLASDNRPRRTEQIVISGKAYGDGDGQTRSNRVRWSFKRLGGIDANKFG